MSKTTYDPHKVSILEDDSQTDDPRIHTIKTPGKTIVKDGDITTKVPLEKVPDWASPGDEIVVSELDDDGNSEVVSDFVIQEMEKRTRSYSADQMKFKG